jgi:8-oxo-dGTP diphosphatase
VQGDGRVLIARRPAHVHQGGLWEFPGGKLEPGEDALAALARELQEELGIDVLSARPLIRIPYRYPDRQVVLDVWRVDSYAGSVHGREGQEIRWVPLAALADFEFPPPNRPIITALRLPDRYLITPEPGQPSNWPQFLVTLEKALQRGLCLVQLRGKQLDVAALRQLAPSVRELCRRYGARLLLNGAPQLAASLGMDGVQLGSTDLLRCHQRPAELMGLMLGASCHTAEELAHACAMGADFALLSPVMPTRSHPGVPPLGWEKFAELVAASTIPVYALGGMTAADIPLAWRYGGQGVAAISGLW